MTKIYVDVEDSSQKYCDVWEELILEGVPLFSINGSIQTEDLDTHDLQITRKILDDNGVVYTEY